MAEPKKTSDTVDLAQFDEMQRRQEDGIDVKILSADGRKPLGFTIKVAGPDSERAMQAREQMADEMVNEADNSIAGLRQRAQYAIKYLGKVTMGWGPRVVVGGEELAYSEENATKLYQRFPFIRDQVDAASSSRARFLKG